MPSNFDLTTEEAVAKLEDWFQRPLPSAYRSWLLDPNAPYPAPAQVSIPDESPWIDRIGIFYAAQQILQTLQEEAEYTQLSGRHEIPPNTIPIGEYESERFLVSLRDQDYGSVLFLFHETADPENDFQEGLYILAQSFDTWLPSLVPIDDDTYEN